jgi:hypothetical protein
MAELRTDKQLERQIEEAVVRGAQAIAAEPRAARAWYDSESDRIMVELTSGILFGFPSEFGQGLRGASARDLAAVEIEGGGYGLHWEALDADLTVAGLVAGVFGSEVWMRELGRRGGSATTAAKQRAARLNGQKGGRPRKNASGTAGGTGFVSGKTSGVRSLGDPKQGQRNAANSGLQLTAQGSKASAEAKQAVSTSKPKRTGTGKINGGKSRAKK